MELESLPYGVSNTTPVQTVRRWYEESFMDILSTTPPRNAAEDALFTEMLERILQRHADVVPMLARVSSLVFTACVSRLSSDA